jgi:hypothetical protein
VQSVTIIEARLQKTCRIFNYAQHIVFIGLLERGDWSKAGNQ